MPQDDKKFSDREVRHILDKAMELQKAEARAASADDGLSFNDLQAAAMEAGINPEFVRRAVRELDDEPSGGFLTAFLGGDAVPTETSRYPERIPEKHLKTLLDAMPAIAGMKGSGHITRSSLSWISDLPVFNYTFRYSWPSGIRLPRPPGFPRPHGRPGGSTVSVDEEPVDEAYPAVISPMSGIRTEVEIRAGTDGTDIRVRNRLGGAAAAVFGGIVGGMGLGIGLGVGIGVGIGALGSVLFATLFPLGCLAGSYLLSRGIFSLVVRWVRKNERRILSNLRTLIDDVTGAPETVADDQGTGEQTQIPGI